MPLTELRHIETGDVIYDAVSGAAFDIPGRYSLSNQYDSHGKRHVFPCRAINVSATSILLAAPVTGKLAERVIALLHHLGKVEGVISRKFDQGFAMRIVPLIEEHSLALAARINWLVANQHKKVPDRRKNARFVPSRSQSKLVFADGTIEDCLILDLSVTGAAVSAFSSPAVGTPLALGSVVGRVVRTFAGGFGVQFCERQNRDHVEAMTLLS